MDVNYLAGHLAGTCFRVEQVLRFRRGPNSHYTSITESFPGFVFPLAGSAEFVAGDTSYFLAPGNVFHGGARIKLQRRVLGNTDWEYMLVQYRVCEEPDEFSLANVHFALKASPNPHWTELLWQLWQVSKQPGGGHEFQTETLFRCVLSELFLTARNPVSSDGELLFEQACTYIHEHYAAHISVKDLAGKCGVNENRLFYVFRKYTGMGPGDYLVAYRLNRAKELILNLELSIQQTARQVGYNDPYHFSRIFKKQFSVSPTQFRNSFRNNA